MRTTFPIQRALVSVETARAVFNRSEDYVLALIESGKLRFAFDVGCSDCHRRTIRIFALSVADFVNQQDTQPVSIDDCLKYILPMPTPHIVSARLAEVFNVGSTHINHLIRAGDLLEIPNRKRTRTAPRSIDRASVIQFLRNRRCV